MLWYVVDGYLACCLFMVIFTIWTYEELCEAASDEDDEFGPMSPQLLQFLGILLSPVMIVILIREFLENYRSREV